VGKPKIVSRGIVDMNEAEELLIGAEEAISRAIKLHRDGTKSLGSHVEEALTRYLYAETGKRPFVRAIIR